MENASIIIVFWIPFLLSVFRNYLQKKTKKLNSKEMVIKKKHSVTKLYNFLIIHFLAWFKQVQTQDCVTFFTNNFKMFTLLPSLQLLIYKHYFTQNLWVYSCSTYTENFTCLVPTVHQVIANKCKTMHRHCTAIMLLHYILKKNCLNWVLIFFDNIHYHTTFLGPTTTNHHLHLVSLHDCHVGIIHRPVTSREEGGM